MAAGAVGGWTSSFRHRSHWSENIEFKPEAVKLSLETCTQRRFVALSGLLAGGSWRAVNLPLIEAAAARRIWREPVLPQNFHARLLGTCRMVDDPRTSVADRYHRSHGVPNLVHMRRLQPGLLRSWPAHPDYTGAGLQRGRAHCPLRAPGRDLNPEMEETK
jgi:hypothetical protein